MRGGPTAGQLESRPGARRSGSPQLKDLAPKFKTGRPHSIEMSVAKSRNLDHSRARNQWGNERSGEPTGLCREPRWEASAARGYRLAEPAEVENEAIPLSSRCEQTFRIGALP